ncbi:MAG: hypothetical protein LBG81_01565 [Coriobacteriaceae bacterium]|jgi:Tfp pilus assembly protein FimV|nr:hypothetical protein [Coriobacteriaceae bacterium]
MAHEKGFSIISMETDEDELVIHAGIKPGHDPAGESHARPAAREATAAPNTPFDTDVPAFSQELPVASHTGARPGPHSAKAEAPTRSGQPTARPPKAAPDDGYRPTTREDLDTVGPLPKARMAIIFGGLVLLVGFLVYYFALR